MPLLVQRIPGRFSPVKARSGAIWGGRGWMGGGDGYTCHPSLRLAQDRLTKGRTSLENLWLLTEARSPRCRPPVQYIGGDPAIDLVNTVDWTSRGPEHDRLTDYGRLTAGPRGRRSSGPGQGPRSLPSRRSSRGRRRRHTGWRCACARCCSRLFARDRQGKPQAMRSTTSTACWAERWRGCGSHRRGSAGEGRGLELGWHDLGEPGLDRLAGGVVGGLADRLRGGRRDPDLRERGLRLDVRRPKPERAPPLVPDGDLRDPGEVSATVSED